MHGFAGHACNGKCQPTVIGQWLEQQNGRRLTMLVIVGALLLYVPFAGTYGLWDPWETHYGEVARQMTVRGDYISLWWPGSPRDQEVFWSKPVLTFWLISLSMQAFGVGGRGGDPAEMALTWKAEWALRMPTILMGVLAISAVYWLVSRLVSRRAGILSALVLATFPMFGLITRQAMTDMVFIGPMTMALCLGAMAIFDDADEVLPRKQWRRFSWPHHRVFYTMLAVFALTVVPQLVVDSLQLRVVIPWGGKRRLMYGALAMIPYYIGSAAFLYFAARSRIRAPLYLYLAAMLCGLAVLAKGLAGLGFPVVIFSAYLAFTWSWKRLARPQLPAALLISILACALVAVPWHHSMVIRHGWAFWSELFGDNHWRRLVMGRHGDRGSFEYFLREMGYAVWPWLAVAPAALLAFAARLRARGVNGDSRSNGVVALGAIWCVLGYGVVSMSMTKFHHYVAPALPGLAIVIGCFLDGLLKQSDVGAGFRRTVGWLVVCSGVPLLLLVLADFTATPHSAERFLWLFNYDYVHSPSGRPWPAALDFTNPLLAFGVTFSMASLLIAFRRGVGAGVALLSVSSVVFSYYLLDGVLRDITPQWTQKHPIAAYYRERASPDEKLVAYMMYWRGETFYTKNAIFEGPREDRTVFDTENASDQMKIWIERNRGKRAFFLYDRGRQNELKSLLPPETQSSFTVIFLENNKFSLARADM
jgi:4-amino-4-deoxy-L-arabinose transferase-like glycosyltransferase